MAGSTVKRFWRSTPPEVDRIQILSDQLERNARWIDAADAKAGAALVFVAAAIGFLLEPLASSLEVALEGIHQPHDLKLEAVATVLVATTVIATFAGARSLLAAFHALLPDVRRHGPRGDVFFGDIAIRSRSEWDRRVESLTSKSLMVDLAEQVHTTARIANSKHHRARSAIHSAGWAIAFGLVAYALGIWVT
jgi:hypothetical protein